MGFWRGVGYFFSIVTLIAGLAVSFSAKYVTHEIYGLMIVVAGVFSIFLIRIIGSLDSIQYDLRYLANKEKKLAELESEKQNGDEEKKTFSEKQEKELKHEQELKEEQKLKEEIKRLEDRKKELEKEKGD